MKGDSSMPTYIVLTNFTQQGIANIKESPGRLDAAKAAVKAMGENSNIEAPDDESIAKLALVHGGRNKGTESIELTEIKALAKLLSQTQSKIKR
jgi:uncharacterized protein with GYD domain